MKARKHVFLSFLRLFTNSVYSMCHKNLYNLGQVISTRFALENAFVKLLYNTPINTEAFPFVVFYELAHRSKLNILNYSFDFH